MAHQHQLRHLRSGAPPLVIGLLLLSLHCLPVAAAGQFPAVEVVGLFRDTAVLRINGQQRLLRVGQSSPEGVRLVSATLSEAVVSAHGEQRRLALSSRVATNFQRAQQARVTIPADASGQYRVRGALNGQFLNCLIDTGATVVALSSAEADRLGINYVAGRRGIVETANGRVTSYFVKLDTVTVGGITRHNVEAAVVRGFYPAEVLLGMSFLGGLRLQEHNGVLNLVQSYN